MYDTTAEAADDANSRSGGDVYAEQPPEAKVRGSRRKIHTINERYDMTTFLLSLAILVGGYFVYGVLVEKVFGINAKRKTPAYTLEDGVDYVPMPAWRVFLIQFLNIAGLGPIFGAIMGVMFGPAAFLWIVFGTIFAGAVHDFVSAMISLRMGGKSLPEVVGLELGNTVKHIMRVFSVVLLILVAAVFVITPAGLLSDLTAWDRAIWIGIIFGYYILATLLPIDKLIGKIYPIFGAALLFMAIGLLGYLLFSGVEIPDGITEGLASRNGDLPVFPMMFVSIACGAISGFHATQSPMMTRCLTNERLARPIFYGAMVAEGLVALIWAAATIAFFGGYEELSAFMASEGSNAGAVVEDISGGWLGSVGGALSMLGVVAAPITTGDTALRSARLTAADMFSFEQHTIWHRIVASLPIFALCFGVMMIDFNVLWRYFAWSNQTLAAFTLWACTVYLGHRGKAYVITLLPALFMTVVCVSYILYARQPEGLGLDWGIALAAGLAVAAVLTMLFARHIMVFRRRNNKIPKD